MQHAAVGYSAEMYGKVQEIAPRSET